VRLSAMGRDIEENYSKLTELRSHPLQDNSDRNNPKNESQNNSEHMDSRNYRMYSLARYSSVD